MSSLLTTVLGRHPSLRAIDRETVWKRHPGVFVPSKGHKVVPAAYPDSVFLNTQGNPYDNKLLADGRTIEFRPSTSDLVNTRLDDLVGREVTLYVYLGRNMYKTGRVTVERQVDKVYLLRMVSPPLPTAQAPPAAAQPPQPARVMWADMID